MEVAAGDNSINDAMDSRKVFFGKEAFWPGTNSVSAPHGAKRPSFVGGGSPPPKALGPLPSKSVRALPPWMLPTGGAGLAVSAASKRGVSKTKRGQAGVSAGADGADVSRDVALPVAVSGERAKKHAGGDGASPFKRGRGRGTPQWGLGGRGAKGLRRSWGGGQGEKRKRGEDWETEDEIEDDDEEDSGLEGEDVATDSVSSGEEDVSKAREDKNGNEEPEVVDAEVKKMDVRRKRRGKGGEVIEVQTRRVRGGARSGRGPTEAWRSGVGRGGGRGNRKIKVVEVEVEDEISDSEDETEATATNKVKGRAVAAQKPPQGGAAALGRQMERQHAEKPDDCGGNKTSGPEQREGKGTGRIKRLASLFKCSALSQMTSSPWHNNQLHALPSAELAHPEAHPTICTLVDDTTNSNNDNNNKKRELERDDNPSACCNLDTCNDRQGSRDAADDLLAMLFPLTADSQMLLEANREAHTSHMVECDRSNYGGSLIKQEHITEKVPSVEGIVANAPLPKHEAHSFLQAATYMDTSHPKLRSTIEDYLRSPMEAGKDSQFALPRRSLKDRVSKLL
eukprot:TRINITY_DN8049_c0_g1_i3.p1 TRINITY_DN8049_c0_g1~~TRINITY_DN8049_c0_g1_i3.p1  ORF type:complete len:566 (+),score=145.52 TRINITY_DN8049_c0_g1_i3:539-2236(+)